ncbi:MAG: hypothetical protein IJ168_02340 [Eubacterium sp.]|nr:hypothetical protein [Eubacterium sp.]
MKKVLSIIAATAMLLSCLVLNLTAFAEDVPELSVGASVTITMPKNGSDEDENKFAKFVPTEDGWYTFTCDKEYTNMNASDEDVASGVIAVDLYAEDYTATQSMVFFMDLSSLSDEEKSELAESGMDVEHIGTLKFTAKLEAGETYYVVGYQDSADDFTTAITVEKHEHTVKQVERTADSEYPAGIYEVCDEWYCYYDELVTPYTIDYEVIEGANQTIKRGETLTVTANGSYDKFQSLSVDGEELSNTDYTVEEGSTIVKLNAEYLDTLAAGKHTLTFEYLDGTAQTDFTIEETATETTNNTQTSKKDDKKSTSKTSPKTGAKAPIAAFSAMLVGGAGLLVCGRKKRIQNN